jgi:leucyl aminopeptidase
MSEMKIDMGGGAAVSAALYGIAKLELPINVIVTVPLCENLPSGHASKPGDVAIAMNGKSIEVSFLSFNFFLIKYLKLLSKILYCKFIYL